MLFDNGGKNMKISEVLSWNSRDSSGKAYNSLKESVEYNEIALEYIEKASKNEDVTDEVFEHLGNIYMELGKEQEALDIWKKGLEKFPNSEVLLKMTIP